MLEPRPARIAGVVSSNLYEAVKELGESTELAADFADIFAWDVDFSRSVQPGDEFRIVYERLYRTDDEGTPVYVRPGRILAAYYSGSTSGAHTAIYYEKAEGHGGYYRPDGTSVQRQFLVAPLRYAAHQLALHVGAPAPDSQGHAAAPRHRLRGTHRHADLGGRRRQGDLPGQGRWLRQPREGSPRQRLRVLLLPSVAFRVGAARWARRVGRNS